MHVLELFRKSRGPQKPLVFNLVVLFFVPLLHSVSDKGLVARFAAHQTEHLSRVDDFGGFALQIGSMPAVIILLRLFDYAGPDRVEMDVADQLQ